MEECHLYPGITLGLKLLFPLKSLVITFLISFLVETSKIWISRGTVYGEKEADGLMLNSDLQIGVYENEYQCDFSVLGTKIFELRVLKTEITYTQLSSYCNLKVAIEN